MPEIKTGTDTASIVPVIKFTLSKDERLNRKKIIEEVFKKGISIKSQAIIIIYHYTELPCKYPAQVMFTASKKLYKRAHDRNRIKRLLREAYRKQKHLVYNSLNQKKKQAALLFIFTGRQLPNYPYVHGKMSELLRKFATAPEQIEKKKTDN